MTGQIKVFKDNQVLFRQGDPANSMYIVRKGALKVFLQKDDGEVPLAELKDGAIVGEMAFFDGKPRSASVRVAPAAEVLEITKTDFDKLLTQLPKWVVTMVMSLSARLRTTNDRVQELEKAQRSDVALSKILPRQAHPFQHAIRCLKLILLAFAKDGTKDGKDFLLEVENAKKLWMDFFASEGDAFFAKVVDTTAACNFFAKKANAQKVPVLALSNRGSLSHFVTVFQDVAQKGKPDQPFISEAALTLFESAVEVAGASGYPSFSVGIGEISAKYLEKGLPVDAWASSVDELAFVPKLGITKAKEDISLKIDVKEHKIYSQYLRFIKNYVDAQLA